MSYHRRVLGSTTTVTPHPKHVIKRMLLLVAASAAVALAMACSQGPARTGGPSAPAPATAENPQTLRPGDVVRLRIWREPDLSGDYLVNEAGVAVFPKLGRYDVLKETPASLQARLLTDYDKYLRNPSIEVIVLRRVRITGAVFKPGLQLLDPTVTIADAVASAGGATPLGEPDKIQIIRDGTVVAVNLSQNLRISDSPIRSGDQIYVPERSWITRNAGVAAAIITGTVSLIVAFVIRH